MEFEGAVVFAGGVVQEEVDAGVVDFLFYAETGSDAEAVGGAEVEEEEDAPVLDLLVVEHELAHSEAAYLLQCIDYRVVLQRKGVQSRFLFVHALHLKRLQRLTLLLEHPCLLPSCHSRQIFLQTNLYFGLICVLPLPGHLRQDLRFSA